MNLAIKDIRTTLSGIQRDIESLTIKIQNRQQELDQKKQLASELERILQIAEKMESE